MASGPEEHVTVTCLHCGVELPVDHPAVIAMVAADGTITFWHRCGTTGRPPSVWRDILHPLAWAAALLIPWCLAWAAATWWPALANALHQP